MAEPDLKVRSVEGGVEIQIRVSPGARESRLVGVMADGRPKVRVAAPPAEGAANRALLILLARLLGVRASQVSLLRGTATRDKLILVTGLSLNDALSRLHAKLYGRGS